MEEEKLSFIRFFLSLYFENELLSHLNLLLPNKDENQEKKFYFVFFLFLFSHLIIFNSWITFTWSIDPMPIHQIVIYNWKTSANRNHYFLLFKFFFYFLNLWCFQIWLHSIQLFFSLLFVALLIETVMKILNSRET